MAMIYNLIVIFSLLTVIHYDVQVLYAAGN